MIDKAILMASIAVAAGQAAANERAPAPSANKGVQQADALRPPANAGDAKELPQSRETADGVQPASRVPPKASDLWRWRYDAETLKMFTEVVHPVTRDPVYRIPPGNISEQAEREGEKLARQERLEREVTLVV